MWIFPEFAVVLALLPIFSLTAPIDVSRRHEVIIQLSKSRRSVDDEGFALLDVQAAHMAHTSDKIIRGLEAFKRNNNNTSHPSLRLDPHAAQRWNKRALYGVLPLQTEDDLMWHGKILVGTPPRIYDVDFDTASADIFLPGKECMDENCRGHAIYDPRASTTAQSLKKPFELPYADGSKVTGIIHTDIVIVAGLATPNQAVGVASSLSTGFNQNHFSADGMFGLGFPAISVFRQPTFLQNLVAQKGIAEPVVSFMLGVGGDAPSELALGFADERRFKRGTMVYSPVTQAGYWEITLQMITVNGKPVLRSRQSIVDTGSSLIVGDLASVKALYDAIPGSKDVSSTYRRGRWTVPCNKLPTVGFTFGGREFPVPSGIFDMGRLRGTANDCLGGVSALPGLHFWIMGDVFLSTVYSSLDARLGRVGFAPVIY